MKTIEQLKAAFDAKPIESIEANAKKSKQQAKKQYVSFLETLFYLERTGRYKENKQYAKSPFSEYLSAQFSISHAKYMKDRRAWGLYPDMVEKYSPSMIATVEQKCGINKVPEVLKAITAKEKEINQTLPIAQVKSIIEKHKKPAKAAPPKVDVLELKDKVIKKTQEVKTMEKVVLSKDEQILKLTATVNKLSAENQLLEKRIQTLLAENEQLEKENRQHKAFMAMVAAKVTSLQQRGARPLGN